MILNKWIKCLYAHRKYCLCSLIVIMKRHYFCTFRIVRHLCNNYMSLVSLWALKRRETFDSLGFHTAAWLVTSQLLFFSGIWDLMRKKNASQQQCVIRLVSSLNLIANRVLTDVSVFQSVCVLLPVVLVGPFLWFNGFVESSQGPKP